MDLPKNWIILSLDELFSVITGSTPSTVVEEYWNDGEIKWITPKDLGKFYGTHISESERKITKQGLLNCSATIVPRDSIIVSTRAPIGYLAILDEPMCFNQGCKALVKKNAELNSKFYFYYLHTKVDEMNRLGSGSTFKEISKSQISNLKFPLPPLPEQHRIVAKLEELFTKLDVSVAELKKAKAQIKRYRQSVLKYAFEGKLTEQWRVKSDEYRINSEEYRTKSNEYGTTTAEELLGKIKEERKKALGKKYKELPPVDTTNLPQLPAGWVWVKNEELLKYVTSGSRDWKEYYSERGAMFIRTQDIKQNYLSLDNVAFVDLPKNVEGKRSRIEFGDMLMTITGANVGKVAVVDEVIEEAYVSQSVALMKYFDKRMMKYLHYYFQAKDFGGTFIENLVYGMGRPVLSLENMREVVVAICPFHEQLQIVSEIERHFSVADVTEKIIDQSLKQAERLRQSILKDAFTGKLVPQDPNDPPASLLLEKIKEEREKLKKEVKPKRRTGEPAEKPQEKTKKSITSGRRK